MNIYDKVVSGAVFVFGSSLALSTSSLAAPDVVALVLGLGAFCLIVRDRMWWWIIATLQRRLALVFAALVLLSIIFLPGDNTFFGIITLYMVGLYFLAQYGAEKGYRALFLNGYLVGAIASVLVSLPTTDLFGAAHRLRFVADDPNVYGAFLVPAILVLVWRLSIASALKPVWRWSAIAGICVLLVGLYATESRGALLQASVAATVLFVIVAQLPASSLAFTKRASFLAVHIGLISILVCSTVATHVLADRATNSDLPRIENTERSVDYITTERDLRTLLIGSGNGSFEMISVGGFSAHNTYLRILIENGLLGLVVCFMFVLSILVRTRIFITTSDVPALFAATIGASVHALFIDTLHWRHLLLILGLM